MSDTLRPQVTGCTLEVEVSKLLNGNCLGIVRCELPGTDPYQRNFRGNTNDPEEASSFYDDVLHELKTWSQLLELALEDMCFHQMGSD